MFMYPSKHAKIPVVVKEKKRGGVSVHARETRENARVRHTRTHARTNERTNERTIFFFICTKKKRAHFPRPFGYSLYCLRNASYLDNPLRSLTSPRLFSLGWISRNPRAFLNSSSLIPWWWWWWWWSGRKVKEEYKNNNNK